MKITDIPASGRATVACSSCGQEVVVVDRYVTDYPPIPRDNPESFVEFYRDAGGDPDDLLFDCPGCGECLDLAGVELLVRYEFKAWLTVEAVSARAARDKLDELVSLVVKGDVGVGIAVEDSEPAIVEEEQQ